MTGTQRARVPRARTGTACAERGRREPLPRFLELSKLHDDKSHRAHARTMKEAPSRSAATLASPRPLWPIIGRGRAFRGSSGVGRFVPSDVVVSLGDEQNSAEESPRSRRFPAFDVRTPPALPRRRKNRLLFGDTHISNHGAAPRLTAAPLTPRSRRRRTNDAIGLG
jgi:hypothetical protein